MPRTGIAILICLMGIVAYGAVTKAAAPGAELRGNSEPALAELSDGGKSDAQFTIIF